MAQTPGLGSDSGAPPVDEGRLRPSPDPNIKSVSISAETALAWKAFLYGVFTHYQASDFEVINAPITPTLEVIGRFETMQNWLMVNFAPPEE
jgi:hypothetical protein